MLPIPAQCHCFHIDCGVSAGHVLALCFSIQDCGKRAWHLQHRHMPGIAEKQGTCVLAGPLPQQLCWAWLTAYSVL